MSHSFVQARQMSRHRTVLSWVRALSIFASLTLWASVASPADWPTVPATFPFNIVQQEDAHCEFRVGTYQTYLMSIQFDYVGQDDLWRVLNLLGDGSKRYPGITLPIHIEIFDMADGTAQKKLVYESTIITTKFSAHVALDDRRGYFQRMIIAANLRAGLYSINVRALEIPKEFRARSSQLAVDLDPYVKFAPYAINIQ